MLADFAEGPRGLGLEVGQSPDLFEIGEALSDAVDRYAMVRAMTARGLFVSPLPSRFQPASSERMTQATP